MRKSEMGKRYFAKIAACILVVAGLSISTAFATEIIETSKACTLTLCVDENGSYAEELADTTLNAKIYKVADISDTGAITAATSFAADTVGLNDLTLDFVDWSGSDWNEKAKAAAQIVEESNLSADKTVSITNTVTADMSVGVYLVMVDDVTVVNKDYAFSPMLVCLPTNPYKMNLSENEADDKNWYDVTATLKPALDLEYGKLEIQKTLTSYNTSLKDVTFVFQIEAKDEAGNVIYSNVASTTHNAAGTKSAIVEEVPIGVELTVTEVYSGASYTVSGVSEQKVTVLSVEEMGKVEFSNIYDDKLIPGYGVVNNFEYNDEGENAGWTWTQLTDNSQVNE